MKALVLKELREVVGIAAVALAGYLALVVSLKAIGPSPLVVHAVCSLTCSTLGRIRPKVIRARVRPLSCYLK